MKVSKIILSSIGLLIFQLNGYTNTDQSIEPPDQYLLKVDGQEFPIELNKLSQLSVKFSNPKIILTVKPTKVFDYGGVYFEYPRYYTFEASLCNKNFKGWTLSGNDAKIMIYNYQTVVGHKAMANIMLEQYGPQKCKLEKCKMIIPNRVLHGTRVVAKIGKITLFQEIYSFKHASGSTLLILQDSPENEDAASAEATILMKMLKRQLRLNEVKKLYLNNTIL